MIWHNRFYNINFYKNIIIGKNINTSDQANLVA